MTTPAFAISSWLRHHPYVTGAMILVLLLAGYWLFHHDKRAATQPLIATVTTGDVENTVTAEGSLKPSRYVDVGAQVSGQLKKLYVDIGDHVTKGQLLAEIDASVQAQKVAASKASLQAMEAQVLGKRADVTLAAANLKRQQSLKHTDVNSQQDYDNAVNALATARSALGQLEAQIVQARAGLASDEAQLGYSKIYAPMAGTVIAVDMNEGQTLNATQMAPTVLRIADLATMTVQTSVSEADVTKLHIGMDVYFTTLGSGTRRWTGKLRQIWPTPQIVNNVVLYTALFDVANPDGALLPDMTAQVFFVTAAAHNVTTVPVGALEFPKPGSKREGEAAPTQSSSVESSGHRREHGRFAFVRLVNDKGKIERRPVRIGVMNRISAEVLSGLHPGDKVIAGIAEAAPSSSSAERRPRFRGFP